MLKHIERLTPRLNHVINYAHYHHSKHLNLDTLADVACMSKYHFTKVFCDYVEETPISFLKRVRLENAAFLLNYPRNMRINDIALDCGFSSHQAFTRAFADRFGSSPKKFRSTNIYDADSTPLYDQINRQLKITEKHPFTLYSKIQIVRRQPIKVAYARNIGNYGVSEGIDEAVSSIQHWAKKQGFWKNNSYVIGLSWDCDQLTPDTLCKFDACVPIPADYSINSDVSVQVIPGGQYAVFRAPCWHWSTTPIMWRHFINLMRHSAKYRKYLIAIWPCYEIFKETNPDGSFDIELYIRIIK